MKTTLTAALALIVGGGAWLASPARGQTASPPALMIERTGTATFQLRWPETTPGFVLQASRSLDIAPLWVGIPLTPSLQGSVLSIPQTFSSFPEGAGFFRLSPKGVQSGLDYLLATQGFGGVWGGLGSATFRDTGAALEALTHFGREVDGPAISWGLYGVAGRAAKNNDELSRQTIALASAGQDVAAGIASLLSSQNVAINDPASAAYPGRGWGLATGYGNSTIDTALVLRALDAANRVGGLSIVKESLAGSALSPAHPFTVPAGSTALVLRVRQRTIPIRLRITYPNSSSSTVDLGAGTTPTDVSFPVSPGLSSLTALNLSASAGIYSAEIGFTGPDGFDYFRAVTPLSFLAGAQNVDGGWGIGPGEDSHLMITAEVIRALAACGSAFSPQSALNAGAAWLLTRQNGDGGFGSPGSGSNAHETSLALRAIQAAGYPASLATAAAYLKNAQLPDGSWGNDAGQTALAVQALYLPPLLSPIGAQSVFAPAQFATIDLDNFVSDPDHADNEIAWTITGNTVLGVSVANRVATITYPPGSNVTEQLTFTATDPDGYQASTSAPFTVAVIAVDHTIARGGSATGTRLFTAASALLDQVAFYTEQQSGLPAGVTYTTIGLGRISATQMQVDFQINVGAGAALGYPQFTITYGLLDSSSNPLTPLNGNVFNFTIQVTP